MKHLAPIILIPMKTTPKILSCKKKIVHRKNANGNPLQNTSGKKINEFYVF